MNSTFEQFRPSKTLWFWSSAACVALTLAVGFTVGGWVTGRTADKMAEQARDDGRAQLAANVCVARFVASDGFPAALAALKAESSWSRDDFVAAGGWLALAGNDSPVSGAADLCAETLAGMDAPKAAADGVAKPTKG